MSIATMPPSLLLPHPFHSPSTQVLCKLYSREEFQPVPHTPTTAAAGSASSMPARCTNPGSTSSSPPTPTTLAQKRHDHESGRTSAIPTRRVPLPPFSLFNHAHRVLPTPAATYFAVPPCPAATKTVPASYLGGLYICYTSTMLPSCPHTQPSRPQLDIDSFLIHKDSTATTQPAAKDAGPMDALPPVIHVS
ncbi:hypothetical protein K439DRAFT_1625558 [Ramaria rubella]|nr:hypothetical protein K439DRAFT_1625558 [Ramaria rubella]